ncbi:helix-turn-helix transcriptional regulator [Serratia ureilytica]|uniref:helix-turn-helix transcriptional regulator n=1 Tax=Serratia ureilytica TaxID=300181 RepID=UPI001D18461D|nr:helix-turn-helix transcriptional regulator [Serratia ureilytica]MCC4106637.1 LuxR C-terminal-related transcriptional regulator [Serratia ureilytica]
MEKFNILIEDDNHYFAAGLRLSIAEYAQSNNKTVYFLASDSKERPDILFTSITRRSQRWRKSWHTSEVAQKVPIQDRKQGAARDARCTLCRSDRQSDLFLLLENVFANAPFARAKYALSLTLRERQVVNYLRNGFAQSQAAKIMGLSVKTVHSHKRSVMSKLRINRNHDFIYWMLIYGEEYSQS